MCVCVCVCVYGSIIGGKHVERAQLHVDWKLLGQLKITHTQCSR